MRSWGPLPASKAPPEGCSRRGARPGPQPQGADPQAPAGVFARVLGRGCPAPRKGGRHRPGPSLGATAGRGHRQSRGRVKTATDVPRRMRRKDPPGPHMSPVSLLSVLCPETSGSHTFHERCARHPAPPPPPELRVEGPDDAQARLLRGCGTWDSRPPRSRPEPPVHRPPTRAGREAHVRQPVKGDSRSRRRGLGRWHYELPLCAWLPGRGASRIFAWIPHSGPVTLGAELSPGPLHRGGHSGAGRLAVSLRVTGLGRGRAGFRGSLSGGPAGRRQSRAPPLSPRKVGDPQRSPLQGDRPPLPLEAAPLQPPARGPQHAARSQHPARRRPSGEERGSCRGRRNPRASQGSHPGCHRFSSKRGPSLPPSAL